MGLLLIVVLHWLIRFNWLGVLTRQVLSPPTLT
jgi:hypothetical protein